jgi:putative oxidoreductase
MRRSIRTTGRILLAILFLGSGATKLIDPAGTQAYMAAFGLPMTQFLFAGAVATELGGGLALLLGWRPRLVALGLAGFLLTATLIFHTNLAKQQQLLHFLKNIAIMGGLLLVVAQGAWAGESADASEPLAARAG